MITILTIAGSDSSGGAGIQADIRTIHRLGAHAVVAVAAVTAQNSRGLSSVHPVPVPCIMKQIETAVEEQFPAAVKIGMLKTHEAVRGVASGIRRLGLKNVVLDPVLRASSGGGLLDREAAGVLLRELVPGVHVMTPNLDEASAFTGRPVGTLEEAEEAALRLKELGPAVVVTGGHFPDHCVDVLCDEKGLLRFPGERLTSSGTHGSGCVFSSSLATALGMGAGLREAVERARAFTREAIGRGYRLGSGAGVVNPSGN